MTAGRSVAVAANRWRGEGPAAIDWLGASLWARAAKEKRPMEVGAGSKEGVDRRGKSGGAG